MAQVLSPLQHTVLVDPCAPESSPALRRDFLRSVLVPPFRKHCARKTLIEELFSEGLGEIAAIVCFTTVFVACFQKSICAMAILSLCLSISEELFLAGLCEARVIIARNNS